MLDKYGCFFLATNYNLYLQTTQIYIVYICKDCPLFKYL